MAHGTHDDHHGPHVMHPLMLLGTFGALMVLTGMTVGAILVDLGPTINFVIAMVIATIKATLVIAFFMHMLYDKRYNFMVLAVAILGVVLFISIAMMDVGQYQPDVDDYVNKELPAIVVPPGAETGGGGH